MPLASLASLIGQGNLVAFDVGPDGVVYLVAALGPLDYRTDDGPDRPTFPKTVPDKPQSYRVIGLSRGQPVLDVLIEGERFNIHHVQPLRDELLLVCSRSHFKGPGDAEKNGRIYTLGGKFAREILLGDGIQSVQATSKGVIWTSYFDEGIFGNYGWNDPIGAAGLVAWDSAGNKLYEFEPAPGMDRICDCYALNVQSEEDVWLYYYTDFPLVRLHRRRIAAVWKMPEAGSDAFALAEQHVLFRGGYDDRDTYQIYSLEQGGTPALVGRIELIGPSGRKIVAHRVVGRGDTIYLIDNESLYRVDVQTAVGPVGTTG